MKWGRVVTAGVRWELAGWGLIPGGRAFVRIPFHMLLFLKATYVYHTFELPFKNTDWASNGAKHCSRHRIQWRIRPTVWEKQRGLLILHSWLLWNTFMLLSGVTKSTIIYWKVHFGFLPGGWGAGCQSTWQCARFPPHRLRKRRGLELGFWPHGGGWRPVCAHPSGETSDFLLRGHPGEYPQATVTFGCSITICWSYRRSKP